MTAEMLDVAEYGGRMVQVEVAGRIGFVILPTARVATDTIDWVWHAPSFGTPLGARIDGIIEPVLRANMAFVGMDVGESFGSISGRQVYTQFYAAITRQFNLAAQAVLLPQSRGGLMIYNWAAEHPTLVLRIAGIYTVCDIRLFPGLDEAAQTFGITTEQLQRELANYNPIERLQPLARAHVPILHIHGDNDTVIPLEPNSAELIKRYQELGGPGELVVVAGQGHAEIDEYFRAERLIRFITTGE